MKITTAAEMRDIDRRTSEEFGVASLRLMEAAGSACARLAHEAFPQAQSIVVVCGKGNNGGDGFVAARLLREAGREVRVVLLARAEELKGDAAAMLTCLAMPHAEVLTADELQLESQRWQGAGLLLDAILGTGVRPPVTGLYADAIRCINALGIPVLAVDVPSGTDSDAMAMQPAADEDSPRCRADAIVTFTAPRPAHVFGNLTGGTVRVAPIGSPAESIRSELMLNLITAADVAPLLAPRALEANKGRFGHALIVGGSAGKAGAAAMAGLAALRGGAGLVTVATSHSAAAVVAGFACELMTEALGENETGSISLGAMEYGRMDGIVEGKNVVAIGPGISRHPDTLLFVRAAVQKYRQPILVIDADGLNAFERATGLLDGRGRTLVLTPHPGEMARLAGLPSAREVQADRIGIARRFAAQHQVIVVLKGWRTLVALPDETVWVNPTGNPGMATGGTGDVLTGLIAGLLAQFPQDPARAVCGAVYLHGLAGDLARDAVGEQCLIAGDLIAEFPQAFRRARDWATEPFARLQ